MLKIFMILFLHIGHRSANYFFLHFIIQPISICIAYWHPSCAESLPVSYDLRQFKRNNSILFITFSKFLDLEPPIFFQPHTKFYPYGLEQKQQPEAGVSSIKQQHIPYLVFIQVEGLSRIRWTNRGQVCCRLLLGSTHRKESSP